MVVETPAAASDVAILSRVIEPNYVTLSAAGARAWLKLDFTDWDRTRMHELALKAPQGTLSAQDEITLASYRRPGCLLDLMHSKARHSLK